jgi:hypothetical protein
MLSINPVESIRPGVRFGWGKPTEMKQKDNGIDDTILDMEERKLMS